MNNELQYFIMMTVMNKYKYRALENPMENVRPPEGFPLRCIKEILSHVYSETFSGGWKSFRAAWLARVGS